MKVQVLVATMNRQNTDLVEQMNIRCDAVIANQADRNEFTQIQRQFGTVRMITTKTRGVGLNRNIALLAADQDILLLADDDVVYNDDMPQAVCKAFQENPKADVIIFSIDILKNGKITERRQLESKRLHVWNSMRFGTYRIAIRAEAVRRSNISFHQCFGGGCPFSAGEDSLFLKACFDKKLRVYASPYVLGTCCKDTSSWFVGYAEKYFYDKGVLVCHLFPKMHYLMAPYFALCFKRKTEVPPGRRLKLVFAGVRGGKQMRLFSQYEHR